MKDPGVRWGIAGGLGVALAALTALWGYSYATAEESKEPAKAHGNVHNKITGGTQNGPVIQGRDFTLQLSATITPALSGLPPKAPAFTGRETELESLLDTMAPHAEGAPAGEGPAVLIAAVGGLAGVGKTELAIQAAHTAQSRGWFPGGVLFVDLFGYDPARSIDPAQALDGWLRALGIPGEHIPPELQDHSRLYASVLATYAQEGRRILVVIDNASTPDQARPLFPSDRTTTTIITSRESLASLPVRLLDLNVLPVPDAVELLDQALQVRRQGDSRIADTPEDAARVAELCGHLPLALTIVAALLAEKPIRSLDSMAADLADTGSRLEELNGVQAAFELSYQRLDPANARLFRLLPVNPGSDISTEATAALADLSPTDTRRGLEALARAHLIDHGTTEGRWRMHDLVRIYADTHPRTDVNDRTQALALLLLYCQDTTRAAVQHLEPGSYPESARFDDRDEALAWLDAEYPNLTAAIHTTASNTDYLTFAHDLPHVLWSYLDWRRHFEDWITLAAIALNAARTLHDRVAEASALNDLGVALGETRRFDEAIAAHQDAAQIRRDTGDRHREGTALNSLGLAPRSLRRHGEAITAHHEATRILRDTGDRHGEGMALCNLGVALQETWRFDESIAACQEAAQIFCDTGDRHSEGIALNNLELVQQAQRTATD
jgi:tetratricopeptide (TPR) repeat protein